MELKKMREMTVVELNTELDKMKNALNTLGTYDIRKIAAGQGLMVSENRGYSIF